MRIGYLCMQGPLSESDSRLRVYLLLSQDFLSLILLLYYSITNANTEPMPPTNVNLIELAQIVSNASLAAMQKFLPVIAICMYVLRVRNLMNLSKHSMTHLRQFSRHLVILSSPAPTAFICVLTYSSTIRTN